MATIHVQHADGREPRRVELTGQPLVFGRDASCDVPLEDGLTSRRHACISRDSDGAWWIEDLRSKNGTLLNARPVGRARLKDGDRIEIGACTLTFEGQPATSSIVWTDDEPSTTHATTQAWRAQESVGLAQRRLEQLYELNERLTGLFARDELLDRILTVCAEQLRFERAGIALWRGDPHPPEWIKVQRFGVSGRPPTGSQHAEIRLSRSLVDRALHDGERILINDTQAAEADPTQSMISNHIRSAMCVPMAYHQTVRGVIYGDRVSSTGGYTKEDIDYFAALGRLGAMGLANVQLVEELKAREQVEVQLQLARQIQDHLFPAEPLILPHQEGRPALTIEAINDPGQKVSGDYYDFFIRPDGQVTIIIADVAGKGVPASLLMANLQAAVHVMLAEQADLERTVGRLNELICRNVAESRFITALFGVIDLRSRSMTFVNAGHLPPYLLAKGRPVEAVSVEPALPLGIEEGVEYRAETFRFPPGPVDLFLYTDGVPDAENEAGESYGLGRLADALEAGRKAEPRELIDRVRRSIKQFTRSHPQNDDITIVDARIGE